MQEVNAVFDIGKTNKKFFLFDKNFKEVYRTYKVLDTIEDEDGFECEDLEALVNWVKEVFYKALESNEYSIKSLNFSTYGASLVHIDNEGLALTHLYNYTKPIPEEALIHFTSKHGDLRLPTASPDQNFLSSGLQLYWLKHFKPDTFKKIKHTLHLPQYLSFLFTQIPVSDYTSIGCHTSLWDYSRKDYHKWVYEEKLHKILPKRKKTSKTYKIEIRGKTIKVGLGIHDSSAALIPYLKTEKQPFILISTGTWSVTLNPFVSKKSNIKLKYLQANGKAVGASKVFLGNEYKIQVKQVLKHFNMPQSSQLNVKFDQEIFRTLRRNPKKCFAFNSIGNDQTLRKTDLTTFTSFEDAYHQLMIELVEVQIESTLLGIDEVNIKKAYIDGGFSDNDIFIKLLTYHFRNLKFRTTESAIGSALGATMVISEEEISKRFLKANYNLKKHEAIKVQKD